MAQERTFTLCKPDAFTRGLVGKVLHHFEDKGLKLVGAKFAVATPEMMREHYRDVAGEPWFEDLIQFVTSGPLLAMVWEGPGAVAAADQIVGVADPMESAPGTIRGDWALTIPQTLVHRARDHEEAEAQIALWFGERARFISEDILTSVTKPLPKIQPIYPGKA